VDQALQIVGALLILAGFGAAQAGRVSPQAYSYLGVNLVGSALLAVLAVIERQWGFVLLETAWAVITVWGLFTRLSGRSPTAIH
jgi:hypothetical protein